MAACETPAYIRDLRPEGVCFAEGCRLMESLARPTTTRRYRPATTPRRKALINHSTERCISFGSLRVDAAVGEQKIERIQPIGVEAALAALATSGRDHAEKRHQVELALKHASIETAHARRQYDAVDPANRLIAGEIERRWNERLKEERRLQNELDVLDAAGPKPADREALRKLGADVERAWDARELTSPPASRSCAC